MDSVVLIWLIFAAALLIGEMLTAGFFLIVFAIGAGGAALAAGLGGGQVWQWVTFVAFSAIFFAFSRKIANRIHRGPKDHGVGAERYMGVKAMVIETVDNAAATGMVRIDREEWRAQSDDGAVIPEGTWAEVVRVDGTRMVVQEAETATGTDSGSVGQGGGDALDEPASTESATDA